MGAMNIPCSPVMTKGRAVSEGGAFGSGAFMYWKFKEQLTCQFHVHAEPQDTTSPSAQMAR